MKKNDKHVSILFIRGAGETNISLKVNIVVIKILLILLILFLISLIALVVFYGKITSKLIFVSNIIKENAELKEKAKKMDVLINEVEQIKELEKKLKLLTKNYNGDQHREFKFGGNRDLKKETSLAEKEIDEFVQNIKLQRNMNYINLKDNLKKRRKILVSAPNILPIDGWISRDFQEHSDKTRKSHLGIDIAAAYNSAIKASGPGIVTFAGWKKDFGNLVEIDHGYGFVSRYGHCSKVIVKKGDMVERSQTIAFIGSSGRSSAPHLHFEILKDGKKVNPVIFILK
jgi:murein DD-endopeptidase MepM/ murein hydrolase activator NlpD